MGAFRSDDGYKFKFPEKPAPVPPSQPKEKPSRMKPQPPPGTPRQVSWVTTELPCVS